MLYATTQPIAYQAAGHVIPDTSLIICSRNRAKLLMETVASVLHGDALPAELLIVDQSDSPHPTLQTLTPPQGMTWRYIWTDSRGLGHARNIGIAQSQHNIIVFVDDDVLAPSTWFSALVQALMEAGPRTAVTGQVVQADMAVPGGFAPSLKTDSAPALYEGRVDMDVLWANNMAMYRSLIEAIGGFDERLGPGARFASADDNEFGFRLLEAGFRVLYAPSALIYHRAWRSDRDYLYVRWTYGRGQGAFYAKHLRLSDPYIARRLWRSVRRHVVNAVVRLRLQRQLAYGDAVYTLGLLSAVSEWLLTQRGAPDKG